MIALGPFSTVYDNVNRYSLGMLELGAKKASAFMSIPSAYIGIFFFFAAAVYIITQVFIEGGDSMPEMAKNFVKTQKKTLFIGTLVMMGVPIAWGLAAVAQTQAQSALIATQSLAGIVVNVDSVMDRTTDLLPKMPIIAAQASGSLEGTLFSRQDIDRFYKDNAGLTNELIKKGQAQAKDAEARIKEIDGELQRFKDGKGGNPVTISARQSERSWLDTTRAMLGKILPVVEKRKTDADGKNGELEKKMKNGSLSPSDVTLLSYAYLTGDRTSLPDDLKAHFDLHSSTASTAATAVGGVGLGATRGLFGNVMGIKRSVATAPFYLTGYMAGIILVVGAIILGVIAIKEVFGVLTYIVGFMLSIQVAANIAAPLAPLFFMLFFFQSTESYAKTYIGFWLSMIFASAGLAAMSGVVAGLLGGISSVVQPTVDLAILQMLGATTTGGSSGEGAIIAAAFRAAAQMVAYGMCLSFATSLVKRGAAIGAGIWSGNFPA